MPNQDPSNEQQTGRARRAFTLRGAVTTLRMLGLVLALGAAIAGAAATRIARDEERSKRRPRVAPNLVVLDSWGMAQAGIASVLRFLRAQHSAQRWYSATIMHDHWLRIGRCEQPGSGYGGVDWYADGWTAHGHFQGGLGISTSLWRENSAGFPPSALLATPEEQMAVATRIYERYGPGAWGCR